MAIPTIQEENQIEKSTVLPQNKLNLANSFFTEFNKAVSNSPELGLKPLAPMKPEAFISEYRAAYAPIRSTIEKAITGASAATGNAMVGQQFMPVSMDYIALQLGNVYAESGASQRVGAVGQQTFPAFQNFGDYSTVTPAGDLTTQTVNDIATNIGVNRPIAPALQRAEIPLFQDPALTAYLDNRGALFALFENILDVKKGVRLDQLINADLTANPTGLTILPANIGQFPITKAIMQLITQFSAFGEPKVFLNTRGFYRLMSEQDTVGNLSNEGLNGIGNGKFIWSSADRRVPRKGLVGLLFGAEVHIVPSILNIYTTNASNAITAQSGGASTFVAVGYTPALGVVRGRPEDDFVQAFTPSNSLINARTGTSTILGMAYLGAGVINPYMWGYYAFTA
jgi:hypothetical protein